MTVGIINKHAPYKQSCPATDNFQYIISVCCATKVAGSIPDGVIGILHWHNPSDRITALGSTQPLTEMSTRSISWG